MDESDLEEALEFAYKGFLSDEDAVRVSEQVRNAVHGGRCTLYKSKDLIAGSDTYVMCHNMCDGYGLGCDYCMYTPKD